MAVRQNWTCDDAYISFRYARNLVEGMGLVFNAGERVEGFTNFLWTVWIAIGLRLGFGPENWTSFWGLAAYAGSLGLLLLFHLNLRRTVDRSDIKAFPVPVALILGVAHTHWREWATGGLETSVLTFILLAAYLLATNSPLTQPRVAQLALVMGISLYLRPDAIVAASVMGGFVLLTAPERRQAAILYAGVLGTLALVLALGRIGYYGDLFPNTYYAKSASSPQYGQGTVYLILYFHRYWPLVLAVLPFWSLRTYLMGGRRSLAPGGLSAKIWLAAALAAFHMLYVARIGGDFMFTRMLIPITPFLLILRELGVIYRPGENRLVKLALTAFLVLGMVMTPALPTGSRWVAGVADERAVYSPAHVAQLEREAEVLSRFIHRLEVRFLMMGSEAIVAYRTRVPLAVDLHGLVDRFTARQPRTPGGRIGHNKFMPLSYAVSTRKIHFIIHDTWHGSEDDSEYIPRWPIRFGDLVGLVLHWDARIMADLEARGAEFEDFPTFLDGYLAGNAAGKPTQVREDFETFKNFYFDHNDDPQRFAAFREILREVSNDRPAGVRERE